MRTTLVSNNKREEKNNFIFHQLRVGGASGGTQLFHFSINPHSPPRIPSHAKCMHAPLSLHDDAQETHLNSSLEPWWSCGIFPLKLRKYLYRLNIKTFEMKEKWLSPNDFLPSLSWHKKKVFYPFSFSGLQQQQWTKKVESSSSMLACVCWAKPRVILQNFTFILGGVCRESRVKKDRNRVHGVADFDFEKWERGCECN